ncbi:MAG: hypothetical protein WBE48_02355 [Xanthobacteraceae bacterium]|jgi:hypothetical protein
MDKLKNYIDALRVVATQSSNFDAQPLAEQRINEYLQSEVDALAASLKEVDRCGG